MTIHLPEDLENPLRDEVLRGRFPTVDEAVAEAVRSYLRRRADGRDAEESAFDLLDRAGLIGCIEGDPDSPTDLATNPVHLDGFGRG